MSAFIVEDRTINSVVSYFQHLIKYDRGDMLSAYGLKKKFKEMGYNLEIRESVEQLALAMFDLNVESIEQRYGAGEAEKFRELDYKFAFDYHFTPVSALKSLRCWLYQCAEGEVPDSSLYKLWDGLSKDLALGIVSCSDLFEKAYWG